MAKRYHQNGSRYLTHQWLYDVDAYLIGQRHDWGRPMGTNYYGIRGIPTLLLFKGGKIVDQKVGAIGKPEFKKMLDAHVVKEEVK